MPNWSGIDVVNYLREVDAQERRVQTEQAARRNIDKRAKDSGLPIEVIRTIRKLRKRDPAEAQVWVSQFLRIGALTGIVAGPLFAAQPYYAPSDEECHVVDIGRAEEAGFQAGRGGLSKDDNPYQPGTEESQIWVKWWNNGVAAFKYANGGTAPTPADKAQPKGRQRRTVEVKAIPAPEALEIQEVAPEAPVQARPRKKAAAKKRANGAGNVVPMLKKRGRPPGSKNKPKTTQPAA